MTNTTRGSLTDDQIEEQRKPLKAWLEEHAKGYALWEHRTANSRLVAWPVGKGIAIVQYFDVGGWELYVPASLSTETAATLKAAEKALDVTPERETVPLRLHKSAVIAMLREHPEEWTDFIRGGGLESAEDAIAFLEASPLDWIDEIVEDANAKGSEP